MEPFNGYLQLLELVSCPAFSVKDGLVDVANNSAQHLLIVPGTPADRLVVTGKEDYKALVEGGCLSIVVETAESQFCAFVNRQKEQDIFLLDQEQDDPTQMALSLASSAFRSPLGNVLNGASELCKLASQMDPKAEKYLNEVFKGAYQMLRLVNNMSDVIPYTQGNLFREALDITSTLGEMVEKASALLERKNIQIHFSSAVSDPVIMANREKLERALYNLILNAATFPSKLETPRIDVELKQVNNRIHMIVTDNGEGIGDDVFKTLFRRYSRRPTTEDWRHGIGLGLPLVRAVAAAHGGTVLVERLKPSGTRVTMTMEIVRYNEKLLRSPRFPHDYAGGYDHALLELSSILPADIFGKM